MVSGISWQRGNYESGRSRNHLTEDGQITICGLKIPEGCEVEILGSYDGIGECQKCYNSPKNVQYESSTYKSVNQFTSLGKQGY